MQRLGAVAEAWTLGRRLWIRHRPYQSFLDALPSPDYDKDIVCRSGIVIITTLVCWCTFTMTRICSINIIQNHTKTIKTFAFVPHHSGLVTTAKAVNKLKPWQTNKAVSRKCSKLLVTIATCCFRIEHSPNIMVGPKC